MKIIILVFTIFFSLNILAIEAQIERINGDEILFKTSEINLIEIGASYDVLSDSNTIGLLIISRTNLKKQLTIGRYTGDDFINVGDRVRLNPRKDFLKHLKSKRENHFGFFHGIMNFTNNYNLGITYDYNNASVYGNYAIGGVGLGIGYEHFFKMGDNLPYFGLGGSYEFERKVDFAIAGAYNPDTGDYIGVGGEEEDFKIANIINLYAKILFPISDVLDLSLGPQFTFFNTDNKGDDGNFIGLGLHGEIAANFRKFRMAIVYRNPSLTFEDDGKNYKLFMNEILFKAGLFF